jgi:hypothetical protein
MRYDDWEFAPGSSGPFGNDTHGPWLPFGDAIQDFMFNIRDCRDRALFSNNWYDIHATLDTPTLPTNHPYPAGHKKSKIRSTLGRIKRKVLRI